MGSCGGRIRAPTFWSSRALSSPRGKQEDWSAHFTCFSFVSGCSEIRVSSHGGFLCVQPFWECEIPLEHTFKYV